jgi:branched-chain amino acid aminotransferase
MKISSWSRHTPTRCRRASKTVGGYVNSSLAKVEAIKAGYDEAIMLGADGTDQRVHRREHLHRERRRAHHAAAVRGRGAARHHPGRASSSIANDLGYRVSFEAMRRDDLYLADEAFLTGTAAEVVPIDSVDDRVVGSRQARSDHDGDPVDVLPGRARRATGLRELADQGLSRRTG